MNASSAFWLGHLYITTRSGLQSQTGTSTLPSRVRYSPRRPPPSAWRPPCRAHTPPCHESRSRKQGRSTYLLPTHSFQSKQPAGDLKARGCPPPITSGKDTVSDALNPGILDPTRLSSSCNSPLATQSMHHVQDWTCWNYSTDQLCATRKSPRSLGGSLPVPK